MEMKMVIKILLSNKFLKEFALVFFASLILNVTCLAAPVKVNAKGSSNSELLLEISESNLNETLSYLSRESGIEFKYPDHLGNRILFSRVIEESNWISLIRILLEDYNTIEIWNKNEKMTKVYIVGDKIWNKTTPTSTGFKSVPNKKNEEEESVVESLTPGDDMPGSNLSESQLFVLLQTSTYRPMPSNIFNSPDFREVLSFSKIESPQDWLDLKKSRTVKQQVQRLLKLKKSKTQK